MAACPSCGRENPGGFKFCGFCTAPLDTAPASPVAEERKVITSLFCDLIGFTASSESVDPEDVDRMLSRYAAMTRVQIEAHGGVVEKFIGDAVVGIFGVPTTHEDDPERAVRAGLRIAEDAEGLEAIDGAPLRLRVGINTGEALVRLSIAPGSGERFLAGDAINTSSRLQSVAPEMGVAVGLATYEATAAIFDYMELEPAILKGKTEPVRVFHARAARARFGTDLTRAPTPFVGREIELALLKGVFDKTVAGNVVQFVSVVGEPGLGKSRIVAELFAYVDAKPGLITWRQGRCLPYGEGITFWALGEIIKSHAGILESDAPDVALTKLEAVLPQGDELSWYRQRLLLLIGNEATTSAERDELFTAWRRFLEHIASDRPAVLVFEDLHWADDAMLSFLEYMADRAEGVPLLVVGTARPEFRERHPGSIKGPLNSTAIDLMPLSEEETSRLISALLETSETPADLRQPLLERAGGNPLYAEELVRWLKDEDLLVKNALSWELRQGAEVPFPHSIQALIAARLDTLSADTKSMLADAAVIGKVFWAGAIAQMGDRDLEEVTETLQQLTRREFIRPAGRSSIEGEDEHTFWHILARDVAYWQVPRASRASRHAAAAAWIESKTPEGLGDIADVLAYHYTTAMDLARAAGQTEQARELEAPALQFLSLAGERALDLDTVASLSKLEQALELTPPGHPGRPATLANFGEAALQAGRLAEAAEALKEAIATFRAGDDIVSAARAMFTLGVVLFGLGDPQWSALPAEGLALLEPLPPGPELVEALTEVARVETLQGRTEAGSRFAEQALALGERLGLDPSARALGYRGMARSNLEHPGWESDMREAIALATDAGQGREVASLHINLGTQLWYHDGPAASLEVLQAGTAFAQTRGLTEMVSIAMAASLDPLVDSGDLDQALEVATEAAERLKTTEDLRELVSVRAAEARILTLRGEATRVAPSLDWLESTARGAGYAEGAVTGLGSSAFARAALGHGERAAALLTEIESIPSVRDLECFANMLPVIIRTSLGIGDRELAERIVEGYASHYPYANHALVSVTAALAEARGDLESAAEAYTDAASRWERFGVVPEQGFALMGQGRCLIGLSRSTKATVVLQHGHEMFERLDAAPALAETDALLERASRSARGNSDP